MDYNLDTSQGNRIRNNSFASKDTELSKELTRIFHEAASTTTTVCFRPCTVTSISPWPVPAPPTAELGRPEGRYICVADAVEASGPSQNHRWRFRPSSLGPNVRSEPSIKETGPIVGPASFSTGRNNSPVNSSAFRN